MGTPAAQVLQFLKKALRSKRLECRPRSFKSAHLVFGLVDVIRTAIGSAIAAATNRPVQQSLKELAEHVLVEGREAPLPVEIAIFFLIPNDGQPLMFSEVDAGSHDGPHHSIAARKRPESDHVDILLSDVPYLLISK